jgi:signal transduction histidine kinase
MIIGISEEGKINIWNNEMANFTQKSAESVINSDVKKFLKMFDLSWNHVQKALDNNEKVEISKKEILLDEKWRFKNIIIFPLKTGNHRQAIIRIDDVTHQVHLEKVLIQSEKMIALGSLALGMAHEINNPITGVIHNIDVLTNRLTRNLPKNRAIAEAHGFDMKSLHQYVQDRKIDKLLELMRSSGQRAAEITISMLNFSRKGNIQKGYYNLKEILLEVLTNLKKTKPSNFTPLLDQLITKMSAPDFDVEIYCNKGQLFEVLISVIKNSLESIDDKTNLPKIDINLQQTKTHLKFSVSDNGAGIKKENRKYIFDPFYTTKSPRKGIGLGLAISYYIIVHNHGGEMYVDDSFDKGTKLVIKLPISGDI